MIFKKIYSVIVRWRLKARRLVLRPFFPPTAFWKYQADFLLLPDCRDISLEEQYSQGNLAKIARPLKSYYNELFSFIEENVRAKKPYAVVRASDGEALFLQKIAAGNIASRHYTKPAGLKNLDIAKFREGLLKCDLRLVEMYRNNRRAFKKIYGRDIFSDIPFECAYALIAGKKLFRSSWRMGIIGSDKKIEIIKLLLERQEYREYIGRQEFQHYIPVPERGAANDPEALTQNIKARLRPDIDVYLVGIGIAKLAVLHRLKEAGSSVFFDAGAGISALAGLVANERPYFGDWINFRLKDFDYSRVDTMDANMSGGKVIFL